MKSSGEQNMGPIETGESGIIFDIRRFTIHDGPGLRSTVFLKGCPLDCKWCHNPEGKKSSIDLWHFKNKCIACHICVGKCPQKALSVSADKANHINIDKSLCNKCGICVSECPANALAFDGRLVTVKEIIQEVKKDKAFYEESHGGVTLSGGEPFYQRNFSRKILESCKTEGINTIIETCLYTTRETIDDVVEFVDEFIIDIKIFAREEHIVHTRADNEIIKANFKYLANKVNPILVRIPLIPEFTATPENIQQIAQFVATTRSDIPIELINYNPLGRNKYVLRNKEFCLSDSVKPFTDDQINDFYAIIVRAGAAIVKDDVIIRKTKKK